MDSKSPTFLLVLAAILFGTWLGSIPASPSPETPASFSVKSKQTYRDAPKVSIEMTRPLFGIETVDRAVGALYEEQVRESERVADETGLYENRKHELSISWDYAYLSAEVVSVRILVSTYTGGAHGNHLVLGKNYDPKTGSEIRLGDLFKPAASYLDVIATMATRELGEKLGESFFEEGALPREENFQSFTLSKNSIVFHFSPYQVAPYALGPQEVEIPLVALKYILKDSPPLIF